MFRGECSYLLSGPVCIALFIVCSYVPPLQRTVLQEKERERERKRHAEKAASAVIILYSFSRAHKKAVPLQIVALRRKKEKRLCWLAFSVNALSRDTCIKISLQSIVRATWSTVFYRKVATLGFQTMQTQPDPYRAPFKRFHPPHSAIRFICRQLFLRL